MCNSYHHEKALLIQNASHIEMRSVIGEAFNHKHISPHVCNTNTHKLLYKQKYIRIYVYISGVKKS